MMVEFISECGAKLIGLGINEGFDKIATVLLAGLIQIDGDLAIMPFKLLEHGTKGKTCIPAIILQFYRTARADK